VLELGGEHLNKFLDSTPKRNPKAISNLPLVLLGLKVSQ
jgi:hypothetical protein